MSYETLAASVDNLAAINTQLANDVVATQVASNAARDNAEAHAMESLAAATVAQAAALNAGNAADTKVAVLRDELKGPNTVGPLLAVEQRYSFTDPRVTSFVKGSITPLNMFVDPGTNLIIDGSVSTRSVFLRAIQAAITYGFTLGIPNGTFNWETGIDIAIPAGKKLSIVGHGAQSTKIVVDDLSKPVLRLAGDVSGVAVQLRNFSIGRLNKTTFTQQKLVLIEYADDFDISGLELYNSVGWNLQLSYSKNGKVYNNLIRDGFLGQASDGIHIYRAAYNIDIFNNELRNLGDDAISVGHGLGDGMFCDKVRVYGNRAYNTNGIKFYGAVRNSFIKENHIRLAKYGASINTYEDVAGVAQGASNIVVSYNDFEDITLGSGDQAAICALWNTGSGIANITGLKLLNNNIRNSRAGIVCLGQSSKKLVDLSIMGNTSEDCAGAGIRTDFTSGVLRICRNDLGRLANQAIYLYNTDSGDTWFVENNNIHTFGTAVVDTYNGIWLRGNPARLILTENTVLNGNGSAIKTLEMGNVTNLASHYVDRNRGVGSANFNAGGGNYSPVGGSRWTTL